MIAWLDSAYAPNAAQLAAAKKAGIGGWAGYFGGPHILNGWTNAEFQRVLDAGLRTLAYCSGWASPSSMKARAAALGIPICLDDEGGIRPDGSWVQGWLDDSGAGLYGNGFVHRGGRRAAFHILAAYPGGVDPKKTWGTAYAPRPAGLVGWQWNGSHAFAGITVDSAWFDDGIAQTAFSGGAGSIGEIDMTPEEHAWLEAVYKVLSPVSLTQVLQAVKAIQPGSVTVDNTAVLAAIADLKAHPAVASDPAVLALVQKIDGHFSGK